MASATLECVCCGRKGFKSERGLTQHQNQNLPCREHMLLKSRGKTVSTSFHAVFKYVPVNASNSQQKSDQLLGHEIPSLDKILKVVGRDPNCDIATFVWWWDTILPAVTGRDSFWNNQVRYYTTICKHVHNVNGKSTHCITPQLEAFALLTVESNRSKWTKMAEEIRKNHPNKVKFLAKEQKEGSVKDPDAHVGQNSSDQLWLRQLEPAILKLLYPDPQVVGDASFVRYVEIRNLP